MNTRRPLAILVLALAVGALLLVAGLAEWHGRPPESTPRDASNNEVSGAQQGDAQQTRKASTGAKQPDSRSALSRYRLVDYNTNKPIHNASILVAGDDGRTTRTETSSDGGFVVPIRTIASISSLERPIKFGNTLHVDGSNARVNALGRISFVFKIDESLTEPDVHVGVVDAAGLSLEVAKTVLKGNLQGLQETFDGLAPQRRLKRQVPSLGVAGSLVVPAFTALRVIGLHPSLYAIRPAHELVFGQQVSPNRYRPSGRFIYPCPMSSELAIEPGEDSEVVVELRVPHKISIATRSFSDLPCRIQLKGLFVADVDGIIDQWKVLRIWKRDKAGQQGEILEYEKAYPRSYRVYAVGRKAENDHVLSCLEFEAGDTDRKLDLDQGIGPHEFTVKLPGTAASTATYQWLLQTKVVYNGQAIDGVLSRQIHFTGLPTPTATLTLFGKGPTKELAIDVRKARFYTLRNRKRE